MSKNELVKVCSKVREDDLPDLYEWINKFSYSRPIKNLHRDFSDGVLMAELINQCLPKFVELHNYSKAHSISQKKYNWNTMNEKVFKRIGFKIDNKNIEEVVNCKFLGLEKILYTFRLQFNKFQNTVKEEEQRNLTTNEKENGTDKENEMDQMKEEEPIEDQMELEDQDTDEIIRILRDKIVNMEKLLKVKDDKIDILNRKIDTMNRMKNIF